MIDPHMNKEEDLPLGSKETREGEMEDALVSSPLISHLIELRERIMKSLLAVCLIFLGLFYFSNDIN